ncbi:MAG: FAD-dependent oxidoreductase, partial [Deltaproteobacteria bacterium]|nr:FAD-dependent oxidoreductase [Deltaproteobacteria bacterium]
PQGHLIPYAEEVKKTVNIPVIGVGRILDPGYAEQLLVDGRVDIVALGRQLLADPEFANKVKEGKIDEIIPCIGCNSGCIGRTITFHTTCVSNPKTGYESTVRIEQAERKKRVMVIGAGPAGIQTALTASGRGHQVTLFEKRSYLGGNFHIASLPDGKQDLQRLIEHWDVALKRHNVDVRLNTEVSPETIKDENPDEVVLAIGATSYHPPIRGIDCPIVIKAEDVFLKESRIGNHVVVAGAGEVGLEIADHLARRGKSVVVVEMKETVGHDVSKNTKPVLLKRLQEAGVDIRTRTTLKRIEDSRVVVEADGKSSTIDNVDNVILALGFRPNHGILKKLGSVVEPTHVIGDAFKVRQALSAVRDGFDLGCRL